MNEQLDGVFQRIKNFIASLTTKENKEKLDAAGKKAVVVLGEAGKEAIVISKKSKLFTEVVAGVVAGALIGALLPFMNIQIGAGIGAILSLYAYIRKS